MAHTILVVEDDPAINEALSENLKAAGYEVQRAANGIEGLEIARAAHPDLILLDYRMPKKNGLEMVAELRNDIWGRSANIVFLTNEDDITLMNGAMQYGIQDYVIKADMSTQAMLKLVESKIGPA